MCCFSGAVRHVSGTQIFARPSGDKQILVYSMNILAEQEVAMILPLPVPPRSSEDAVRFINLEAYPQFFTALNSLFPAERSLSLSRAPVSRGPLAVQDVGRFEASFVPTLADFERLDPRFRLPSSTWRDLPQYADWGFAVFKLKQPQAAAPQTQKGALSFMKELFGMEGAVAESAQPHPVHPMAFEFPRHDRAQLFFPTVHVHDGEVHKSASFDHELYFQAERTPAGMDFPGSNSKEVLKRWGSLDLFLRGRLESAAESVELGMDLQRAAGTLHPSLPLYRWKLRGQLPNQDSVLEL